MTRISQLTAEFIEFAPPELKDGVLYVSMIYGSAVHKCCCGCGEKVVTPFSPTDWKLTFDGETVSLRPSIGNWSFACRSHYWIRENEIHWAPAWSEEEIEAGRKRDREAKAWFFRRRAKTQALIVAADVPGGGRQACVWQRVKAAVAGAAGSIFLRR
jgi:hypothetical protein